MKLQLVRKITEAKDTVSFFFLPSEKVTWQAGQYAYLTIGEITKQFTIASSPTEEFIQITTRIREGSEFKQNLNRLEIGSKIEARLPFGTFVLDSNYLVPTAYHVFLAGGIGITPFRSMIKYNLDLKLNIPMYLIYSNSDNEFVFKNELDAWQKGNNLLKIEYVNTSVDGRVDKLKISNYLNTWNLTLDACFFWLVGPPGFVTAMENILEELKIPEDNVKTEKFTGY